MKALVGMLVVASLVSGTAQAAVTKRVRNGATAKKSKITKKAQAPKAQKVAQALPTELPPAAQAPAPAPAATTSTASVSTVTAEAAPKRWSFMYDTWSEVGMEDANYGRGNFDAAETIRVGYKLTPVLSISLTNTLLHTWGYTTDNRREFSIDDPYLMLAHSKILGDLGSTLSSKAYVRFYPGVSESSRNKDQVGFVRGMWNLGVEASKALKFSYQLEPRYYFQRYKTYQSLETRDADGAILTAPSEKVTTAARLKQFVAADVSFGKLGFHQNFGIDYEWYNSDPEANKPANRDVAHKEFLYVETGLEYALNDVLTLAAGVYSEKARNLLDQKNDFSIYRDNESLYYLEGTVAF